MKKNYEGKESAQLNMLMSILNGMDAYLYVSDLQTDEILFINDRMKEHFKLAGEAVGNICWRVLQSGFEKRCEFCPNYQLSKTPDIPVIWEEHNTVTGRYYRNIDRIIDWSDGKKVHLQHSTDITDIKLAEASLKKRLRQQEIMSAISQSFTTTLDTRQLITDALGVAGEFMKVNHAFLSQYRKDEDVLDCLFEWCDEDGRPFIGNEGRWPITPDMDIYNDLTVNRYVAVDDYRMLTHPNFQALKQHELRAFFNIPIEVSGEFWGVLGFIIYKHTYHWDESDIHFGKILAGVFSGVISRDIAERDLLKAKETAEQASRAKGEFLSRMSHEMRTPMNAIIGMANIAKNSDDLEKKEYCLEKIDYASKNLLNLINDILDMSKIEANKFELSPSEFDFKKMVLNIIDVVIFQAEAKNQSITVNVGEGVPSRLIGDELRLSQVFINLLTNAIKFTPQGGKIMLGVRSADMTDETTELFAEVIDNGIGISAEQQTRLFAPFEQADGGIARKYGGTGLGLAICKKIVELMDGQIRIDSELGKGSAFSFTVKMKNAKEESASQPDYPYVITGAAYDRGAAPPDTAGNTARAYDFSGCTLLIAEDIEINREIISAVLEDTRVSYDFAWNGLDALSMFESNPDRYSLILMDIQMPEMDGYETTRRVRASDRPRGRDIPIIAMTANVFREDVERCIQAGMNGHIGKPLDTGELMAKLDAYLNIGPAEDERIGVSV